MGSIFYTFKSWLCKSEIELTVGEEVFSTGIARLDKNGTLDGSVCIKVFSTTTIHTIAAWESDFLCSNPSLQIHSVSKFNVHGKQVVAVLLSVWDRRGWKFKAKIELNLEALFHNR